MTQTTARAKWRRLLVLLAATSTGALAWVARKRGGPSGWRELSWSDPDARSSSGAPDGASAPPNGPEAADGWWEAPATGSAEPGAPAGPDRAEAPVDAAPKPRSAKSGKPSAAKSAAAEPAAARSAAAKPPRASAKPGTRAGAAPATGGKPGRATGTSAEAEPQTLFDNDGGIEPGPYPNSALPLPDGSAPSPEYVIKGNSGSMRSHAPSSPYYGRTRAEVWFRTEEDATAAGFQPWTRKK